MIQEFYLSITPVGSDAYLVRTERVAPGVPLAEEQVSWPVDKWLSQASRLMNDPVLTILQGQTSLEPGVVQESFATNLVALGQEFYNVLFQGTIRDSWMTAQGIAYHRREPLRLRLGLKGDRLPRLPWEVLHAGNRPIATGTDIVFSRYQPTFTSLVLPLLQGRGVLSENGSGQQPPLNILMVMAAPLDQESLELKQEVNQLQQELQQPPVPNGRSLAQMPQVQLTILEQPDREQLTQALEQGHYQVMHYAGHSNLAAAGGNLYLVNRRTGLTETLSGDDLAGLLVNNGIRMAVFNSCRGAHTATNLVEETGERSLAEALVRRGIPAVLAMAEQIPDEVALTLTRLFYRNLRQGYPVDLSVSRARQGLVSTYGSQQLYWALPILYMHPEFEGYLAPAGELDSPGMEVSRGPQGPAVYPPVVVPQPIAAAPVAPAQTPAVIPSVSLTSRTPIPGPNDAGLGQTANGTDSRSPLPIAASDPIISPPVPRQVSLSGPGTTIDHHFDLATNGESEFGDLIEDLEYLDDLSVTEEKSPSVSELIRRLSQNDGETELDGDEPLMPASNFEDLLPSQLTEPRGGGYLALDLPENPRYRSQAAVPAQPAVADLKIISFNSFEWQVKDFIRVPFVPFVAWRTAVVKHLQLPVALGQQGQHQSSALNGANPDQGLLPGIRPSDSRPNFISARNAVASQSTEYGRPTLFSYLWPLLAGVGVTLAVLGGVKWLPQALNSGHPHQPTPQRPSPSASSQATSSKPSPQPTAPASSRPVVEQGILEFQQGNLSQGQRILEQLLDQGALADAEAVLAKVTPTQVQKPEIQFLKGRLAVQSVKAGRAGHSLVEARRFFDAAVKAKPESLPYLNALGLTTHAVGDLKAAGIVWFSAGLLVDRYENSGKLKPQDLATFHAAFAVTLFKSNQRAQAIAERDRALEADKVNFQPDKLAKHWMWSDQAVQDWQALLKL